MRNLNKNVTFLLTAKILLCVLISSGCSLLKNKPVKISASENHSCAVFSNGSIRCWGGNSAGQAATKQSSNANSYSSHPTTVSGITNALDIATGPYHDCVLLSDGKIKCWGANYAGQLGDGTTTPSTNPVSVKGISNATKISVGTGHSCAILKDNTMECWGENVYGQLGIGTHDGPETCSSNLSGTSCSRTPVTVTGANNAIQIAAGAFHTCAVLLDGKVKCWGMSLYGQLGNGRNSENCSGFSCSSVPVFAVVNNAKNITAGHTHTCALLSDGYVRCWGGNSWGQLGLTIKSEFYCGGEPCMSMPYPLHVYNAAYIAAGYEHTCIVLLDKTIKCWGNNNYGQLGIGTSKGPKSCSSPNIIGLNISCSEEPMPTQEINNVVNVAAGLSHSCALLQDGKIKCWGLNRDGQLGLGSETGPGKCDGTPCSTKPVDVLLN